MKKMPAKKTSRRGQLVCEHLENVSRKALEKYQPIIREYVRGRHGVYALYKGNRLYYVGLASNLINRLKHHLTDRHAATWDRFSVYLTQHDKHIRELETLAIRIADPKGNRTRGSFVRSENLRKRFGRDMYKWMKQEIGGIFSIDDRQLARRGKKTKSDEGGRAASANLRMKRVNLGDHIDGKLKLRLKYKGNMHHGILNEGGTIKCSKGVFKTPSGAAKAVVGRDDNGMNGWYWWRFERTPGEWRQLRELAASKKAKTSDTKKAASSKIRSKAKQSGKWPLLRDYLPDGTKLRIVYKGQTHYATIKDDGRIWSVSGYCNTPSAAAKAIIGRSANGWYWWRYEKSPGEWARIDELRKRKS